MTVDVPLRHAALHPTGDASAAGQDALLSLAKALARQAVEELWSTDPLAKGQDPR